MRRGVLAIVLVLLVACSREPFAGAKVAEPPSSQPAASNRSGVAAFDVYVDDDRIHLLTTRFVGSDPATVTHSMSVDGGDTWSTPVRVEAALPPHAPARGNDPQVAAWQGQVIALWTSRGGDEWGGGKIVTALSRDGGRTWQPGPSPAPRGSNGGQYYIAVAAGADGAFHLVWLDDRDGKRGLRYARSHNSDEAWSLATTLDETTCECCWNTLLASSDRVYVLYRNDRPRDMALTRSQDRGNTWQRAIPVGAFDWMIDACPHSGGGFAQARQGRELHALVSTGQAGHAGLHHLRSEDDGAQWSSPQRVGSARAAHPDLAIGRRALVAAWDEWTGDTTAIHYATSYDGGTHWSAPRRLSAAGTAATHPRVISTGQGFLVFWTERRGGASQIAISKEIRE